MSTDGTEGGGIKPLFLRWPCYLYFCLKLGAKPHGRLSDVTTYKRSTAPSKDFVASGEGGGLMVS